MTVVPRQPVWPVSLPQTPGTIRLQALVVVGLVVGMLGTDAPGNGFLLVLMLGLMAVAWPPAVSWAPLAARRVVAAYVPFAIGWLLFTVGYLYLMHAAGAPVAPQPQLAEMAERGTATPGLFLRVIGIVLVAPLLEEIVFRGYLFAALRTWLSPIATQLGIAVLFGLVHGLPYALPIGVLALLFGWLRVRHESLLPCVFAHALHNGLTVAVTLAWPTSLELMYPR